MIKFATTRLEFNRQIDDFLASQGLPVDDNYRALAGSFVQHMDNSSDSFDPDLLGRMIRKQLVNEWAYYLIKPEQAPSEDADGPEVGEIVKE